jgi:hypothetical protein
LEDPTAMISANNQNPWTKALLQKLIVVHFVKKVISNNSHGFITVRNNSLAGSNPEIR